MISTKLLTKVCLCLLALTIYASPIKSEELEESTPDSISSDENESFIPKNRHRRAAQIVVGPQRLVTFVNGVPVQVPLTRQFNANQIVTANGVVTNLPTALNGVYSQFPIYQNMPYPSLTAMKRAYIAQRLQAAAGQLPYGRPVIVTVPVQQPIQQQVPANQQLSTTQNPVVNAIRLLQLANQVQQLQMTSSTTTTTTAAPPTAQAQARPQPQQQPLPINIVIQSPGQNQQQQQQQQANIGVQSQQSNQQLNAVASTPIGQVQRPSNPVNFFPTPSVQPQQQSISTAFTTQPSSNFVQSQQLPMNFFPSNAVQQQQQPSNPFNLFPTQQTFFQPQQQPNLMNFFTTQQPLLPINFFPSQATQTQQQPIQAQQMLFPINVVRSVQPQQQPILNADASMQMVQATQQPIQNAITASSNQIQQSTIPMNIFSLPSVQPVPVQSQQQITQNTVAPSPPQIENRDDGTTTSTIQEILTNIQDQQATLAQASFPTIHFYIFGYLLIGVTIGICVYVYVDKKKKSLRQSVRVTQPHRFAVPSRRAQRSSYP